MCGIQLPELSSQTPCVLKLPRLKNTEVDGGVETAEVILDSSERFISRGSSGEGVTSEPKHGRGAPGGKG